VCDFRYRGSYCAHGKVKGPHCLGDKCCPVKERERTTFLAKEGWYQMHKARFQGVWRE
jgi:hypothetical protein